jgi:hypothetical protein
MSGQLDGRNDPRVPQQGTGQAAGGGVPGPDQLTGGPSAPRAPPPHHYREEAKEGGTQVPQAPQVQLHHDADLRHRLEGPGRDEEPPAAGHSTAVSLDKRRHLPPSSPSPLPSPSPSPERPNLFVANPDPFHSTSSRPKPHLDRSPSPSETLISPRDQSLISKHLQVSSALQPQQSRARHTVDPTEREDRSLPPSHTRDRGCSIPSLGFTPKLYQPKSIRPLTHAIMAFEQSRKFSTGTSVHRKRQMSTLVEKEGHFGPALTVRETSNALCFARLCPCGSPDVFAAVAPFWLLPLSHPNR